MELSSTSSFSIFSNARLIKLFESANSSLVSGRESEQPPPSVVPDEEGFVAASEGVAMVNAKAVAVPSTCASVMICP